MFLGFLERLVAFRVWEYSAKCYFQVMARIVHRGIARPLTFTESDWPHQLSSNVICTSRVSYCVPYVVLSACRVRLVTASASSVPSDYASTKPVKPFARLSAHTVPLKRCLGARSCLFVAPCIARHSTVGSAFNVVGTRSLLLEPRL